MDSTTLTIDNLQFLLEDKGPILKGTCTNTPEELILAQREAKKIKPMLEKLYEGRYNIRYVSVVTDRRVMNTGREFKIVFQGFKI